VGRIRKDDVEEWWGGGEGRLYLGGKGERDELEQIEKREEKRI